MKSFLNKKYFWLIPFILFSGLILIDNSIHKETLLFNSIAESKAYNKGLLDTESKSVDINSDYNMAVIFNSETRILTVDEKISWRNLTKYSTSKIYFHFYSNAYQSNHTLFAEYYKLQPENETKINISDFVVNGENSNIYFIGDSTVGFTELNTQLNPGDSVILGFKYQLKIPIGIKRFGSAKDKNFHFISQWFPKVGVFENGNWECRPYYPYLNFYSDFSNYNVKIEANSNYKIASTGKLISKSLAEENSIWQFEQFAVHDFAFALDDEFIDSTRIYVRDDNSSLSVKMFIQPSSQKYIERYFTAMFNSLKYMEKNVGIYPYETLTLVDVPKTSASSGMEYPTLFNVSAKLFSPEFTNQPEKLVVHEFLHQYFYGILANNEVTEAWLDEGLTSYFADKIMVEYYPPTNISFTFADHLPVPGMNFLSFYGIPVIYSLGYYQQAQFTKALSRYYKSPSLGAIADTSFSLPNRTAYSVNSYFKPELMLHSLERILGEESFRTAMKEYYSAFKFKHPTGNDLFNILSKNSAEVLTLFKDQVFNSPASFDDRIKLLRKIEENKYELILERLSDGLFNNEVAVYTAADTIWFNWNTSQKIKIIKFNSDSEVLAAEIDPKRKNIFDQNYANNSFTMDRKIWGITSLTIKWFFWVQNALVIFGSLG